MKDVRVLAINPGSTSTKIAVYQNTEPVFLKNIKHTAEELAPFPRITDQFQFRKEIILISILRNFRLWLAAAVY
jgi:butyrate kinase